MRSVATIRIITRERVDERVNSQNRGSGGPLLERDIHYSGSTVFHRGVEPTAPPFLTAVQPDRVAQSAAQLGVSIALNESFDGDGAAVSYLNNVRTTKRALPSTCALPTQFVTRRTINIEGPANLTVLQIVNDTQGADDMSDHEEWISYSHWGMFPLEPKSSK